MTGVPWAMPPAPRRTAARCLMSAALLAGGCVASSFDPTFDRAARAPAEADQPIVGAWQGRWAAEDGSAGGPARVVVTAGGAGDAPGTRDDRFAMELVGFTQADAGQRFTAEAVVDPRGGPVRDFAAKMPAVVLDGDLCAAALGLQAHADGDHLHVDYWLNDALQQIGAGHVDLQRVRRTAGTRDGDEGWRAAERGGPGPRLTSTSD